MSEAGESDKTEQPTEKRITEALDKGQLPLSREAPLFGFLATTLLVCTLMLRDGVRPVVDMMTRLMDNPGGWTLHNGADALDLARGVGGTIAGFVVPIALLFMAAGLAISFAQNRPRIVLSRIAPNFEKLSPLGGIKRLLGRDGLIEFAKNAFKLTAIGLIISLLLNAHRASVIDALYAEPDGIPEAMLDIFVRLILGVGTAFVVLAAVDLVWSRIKWRKSLMMSRHEVKEEMKQAEGDPLVKSKRRSQQMEKARRRMFRDVKRATMVIANPTHYAIALRYVRNETAAPVVVAKGQDLIALKIREIAEAASVTVIEDKLLARSMYDHVEVSKPIPPQFYKAVAEVIHFIQTRNAKRSTVSAKVLR